MKNGGMMDVVIAQNNCWGINMYGITVERKRKAIKYVEASFDSRDGTIWLITFRQIINSKEQEISFRIESKKDVDRIYSWLDETIT